MEYIFKFYSYSINVFSFWLQKEIEVHTLWIDVNKNQIVSL